MKYDGVVFDDWWYDEPNALAMVYMCEECARKHGYSTALHKYFGVGVPDGAQCGVYGCHNEAEYDYAIPMSMAEAQEQSMNEKICEPKFMYVDGRNYFYQLFTDHGKCVGVNLYDGDSGMFIEGFDTMADMESYVGWKGETA